MEFMNIEASMHQAKDPLPTTGKILTRPEQIEINKRLDEKKEAEKAKPKTEKGSK